MKVHTIEIAKVIEQELQEFVKDWGGGYPMKFTRFIDIGGRQTDLYVYGAEEGSGPWMIIRIKAVMESDQGECIQVFVNIAGKEARMEEVLVSPEAWKLPALADRVLTFVKNDMLGKIAEGGAALGSGAGDENELGSGPDAEEEEEDYDDLDTSGILAGGGGGGADADFNPEDFIAQANASDDTEDVDPSDLIAQMNAEGSGDEEDVDPSDLIAQMNAEGSGDEEDVDPSDLIARMNEQSEENEEKD